MNAWKAAKRPGRYRLRNPGRFLIVRCSSEGEASSTGARRCPSASICSECDRGTDTNSRWQDAARSPAVHDSPRRGLYIPPGRLRNAGDEDAVTGQALLDVRQMLDRLIGFDTTSRNSNLALIEFVRDYLDRLGIASELVFDAAGAKANLFASIGPEERAGLVLSGHTDVVPVDGQVWSSDAFTCVAREGRLYGRGAADMKGFIATALALVPELQALRARRPGPPGAHLRRGGRLQRCARPA